MTEDRKPGVAQTVTLMFENEPRWSDLFWFVDKAREAGVKPHHEIVFEWGDDEDPHAGLAGMSFFEHPDTTQADA